jgi:predicted GNAT family N-acyltransferase
LITVNACAFAVPAYRKVGFEALGPALPREGVIAIPMALPVGGCDLLACD